MELPMDVFSRREFLERSAILSAAAAALGTGAATAEEPTAARTRSVNDKIRVAVVGVRGRGMSHVEGFAGKNNCEITVVCDCDEGVIGRAMKSIEAKQGAAPKFEKDIRRVVESKDIDVVSIATPNHWHALMAIWAMQNGKDVYCEKPVSHNVREGRLIVEAARKYNRVCQCGTQSRSNPGMRDSIAHVHSGKIGKVDLAIGLCYKLRPSIGRVSGDQAPPATMDYDLWCGPAPLVPPHRKTSNGTVHYDWHWIWNYGNGDLGNQGIHEMDKARWGLNKNALPNSVVACGGRFGYVDDGQTANTQVSLFDFGDAKLVFEVRGLPSVNPYPHGVEARKKTPTNFVGNIWSGSEGMVVCPDYQSGIAFDKSGKEVARFKGGSDQFHFDNFVKAVRSRKAEDLNGEILEGHLSSALCHLANISYRLGSEMSFDKDITGFSDCAEAESAIKRMKEHLGANKVDLAKAIGRVGSKLALDPKAERFTGGNAQANAMLFREYRKGFEVKETV
jgi:predicted dehydrogenase